MAFLHHVIIIMIKPLLDKQVFQATTGGKYETTQGSALLANVGSTVSQHASAQQKNQKKAQS